MRHPIRFAALVAALVLAVPTAASAHVTLQPKEAQAGSYKRFDIRVPNERDNASTQKVEVQFPAEAISTSYEPVPGWNIQVNKVKVDPPIKSEDGDEVTERVDSITFTAVGEGIQPGQFRDFGLSLGLPDKPDTTLTFKAIQTYSNGEIARWIGDANAEQPAPTVKLTAAATENAGTTGVTEGDEESSDGLAIAALVFGVLGLIAGIVGIVISRGARSKTA